jgi:hypothetical protein
LCFSEETVSLPCHITKYESSGIEDRFPIWKKGKELIVIVQIGHTPPRETEALSLGQSLERRLKS